MTTLFNLMTIEETKRTVKVPPAMYDKVQSIINKDILDVTFSEFILLNSTPIFDWPYTTDLFNDIFERYGKQTKEITH